MAVARKLTTKIYEIQAHPQKVTCLDLGETGRVLVTGSQDRNVNLWAIGSEHCFKSLTGHNGQIDCVKFAYNDNFVYSADEHGIIKRWDLNGGGAACSTFYGHMKSVRTLDFHPYGEYVVSGSNDTAVRLWDVRKKNACLQTYRGHIANVNSVRFSPDGSWIASAGTEGCLIIWDIRQRKKIIEFQEHASPITCIQFHPFEFLIAAGRNDGTVDLYDLESQKLISRTDANSAFSGHTVKCVAFSENGECLFVGTAEGISVIGWEPDREFDHIEGAWSILGDMKVLSSKVYCASYEQQTVKIHDVLMEKVIPFYNPSNQPFAYNQSSRKSFTRGSSSNHSAAAGVSSPSSGPAASHHHHRLNLSKKSSTGGSPNKSSSSSSSGGAGSGSYDQHTPIQSPSPLSFDMIEEEPGVILANGFHFESYAQRRHSSMFIDSNTGGAQSPTSSEETSASVATSPSMVAAAASTAAAGPISTAASQSMLNTTHTLLRHSLSCDDDSSSSPSAAYLVTASDLDYYPQRSGLAVGRQHGAEPEREDFPIQSATPPDYAPKSDIVAHQLSQQQKQQQQRPSKPSSSVSNIPATKSSHTAFGRRHSPPGLSTTTTTNGSLHSSAPRVAALTRKFGGAAHSQSTLDLHQASSDESLPPAGSSLQQSQQRRGSAQHTATASRNYISAYASSNHNNNNNNHSNGTSKSTRTTTSMHTSTSHYNRENTIRSQQHVKKIPVQIYESAPPPKMGPTRSKTSLDLRSASSRVSAPSSPTLQQKRRTLVFGNAGANGMPAHPHQHNGGGSLADDNAAFALLAAEHEQVLEHLSRRHATLMLLKSFTRTADVTDALGHAIQIKDPSLLVDLFGIILESNSVAWNLDMVLLLLPALYDLLRSANRFHIGRACDTLRHILAKFLPIIQDNSDPYGPPRSLGVDITAEERRNKCVECRSWLLHIKALPADVIQMSMDSEPTDRRGVIGGIGGSLLEVQNMIVDL